jgi:23S rRNA (uracil1939-C5)-methyltransferase
LSDELSKNQILEADVEGYSSEGAGVCRIGGRAVFVPGALRGERWEIRILKVGSHAVWARGERCLRSSGARVESDCPYSDRCGGCSLRHMNYAEELGLKLRRVGDALQRIGGFSLFPAGIIPADLQEPGRYKTIFAVGTQNGEPVTGFYRPRSHDIVAVEHCRAVPDAANHAAAAVRAWIRKRGVPVYDEAAGREGVRHIFVRCSRLTGEAMVCLVSSIGLNAGDAGALEKELRAACPEMSSLVLCLNRSRGNTVLAGRFHTLWGASAITDGIGSLRFALSPQSFFQVNPLQAERLYQLALEYTAPAGPGTALDLYCGAGTISLYLARVFDSVIGAEIVPEAVRNAKDNAAINRMENVEFLCAEAAEAARELSGRHTVPAAVVLDPPRKGLEEAVIETVAGMKPRRVVYVSCDPGTLARDLKRFWACGYTPAACTLVDMFPRTHHVECVIMMTNSGYKDK